MGEVGLEAIDLLAGLPPEELRALEKRCRWRGVGADNQIIDQSDEVRDVYFVIAGVVHLVRYTLSGREIFFGTVRRGGYFGEISATKGSTRDMGAKAIENCRLALMPRQVFRDLLASHRDIMDRALDQIATTVRALDERIVNIYTLPAPMRVYTELLRLAQPDAVAPGSWVIWPMRTCAEIASRAHTTRETATRAISELSGKGIVERVSKGLYIRDRDQLIELAGRERQ